MARVELKKKLDEIIKEIISPILKKNGFKKSLRNFYKTITNFGICFNIQSSQSNTSEQIKFTFNISLFIPEIYKIEYESDPPKFPCEYDGFNRKRSGHLIFNEDYWYEINKNTKIEDLKDEIKSQFEKYLIPYINSFKSNDDIINLYKTKKYIKSPEDYRFLSGFLIINNIKDEGEKLLKEHFNNSNNNFYKKRLRDFGKKFNIVL